MGFSPVTGFTFPSPTGLPVIAVGLLEVLVDFLVAFFCFFFDDAALAVGFRVRVDLLRGGIETASESTDSDRSLLLVTA